MRKWTLICFHSDNGKVINISADSDTEKVKEEAVILFSKGKKSETFNMIIMTLEIIVS